MEFSAMRSGLSSETPVAFVVSLRFSSFIDTGRGFAAAETHLTTISLVSASIPALLKNVGLDGVFSLKMVLPSIRHVTVFGV